MNITATSPMWWVPVPDVRACMPPKVAVPKPGPCPGARRGVGKRISKAVAAPAKPAAKRKPATKAAAGPGSGRDLSASLDMDAIAALPVSDNIGADQRLAAIAAAQGFDARPQLADQAALDAAVAAGGRRLYRGVKNTASGLTAKEIHDDFAHGDVHFGQGIFGNGTYYSTSEHVAAGYADFDYTKVRQAVLPKTARTITYPQLLDAMARDTTASSQAHQQRAGALLASLATARDTADMRFAYEVFRGNRFELPAVDLLRTDPGAWAMARGYDAVIVPIADGMDEVVLLNRGAALIDAAQSPPPAPVATPDFGVVGRDILPRLDMNRIAALSKKDDSGADRQLTEIAALQGFDAPPRIGTAADLDALIAQGGREVFRGTESRYDTDRSGEQFADDFRTGDAFYGSGFSGNGIYVAPDYSEALGYAKGNPHAVVRLVLRPDARVADLGEIRRQMDLSIPPDTRARLNALAAMQRAVFTPGGNPRDVIHDAMNAPRGLLKPQDWLWMDPSTYAAARGYDAVEQPMSRGRSHIALLNRSAVLAQAADRAPRTVQQIDDEKYGPELKDDAPPAPVAACLKPGQVHPGPCKGSGKGVRKAVRSVSAPKTKAVPKKKTTPAKNAPARAGRAAGRDLTGEVDYGALAQLPTRMRTGEEDQRLAAIARAQGFDGLPTLASADELDDMIAAGGHELFRGTKDYGGTTGDELARQMRTGRAFFGTGDYGPGIYMTPSEDEAFDYAGFGQGGINRAVLPADARVIDYPELISMARAAAPQAVARMQAAQSALLDSMGDPAARAGALAEALDVNAAQRVRALAADTSLHAAAKGYDAIRLPYVADSGDDYWIILNRSALTVQDRDRDPSFAAACARVHAGAAADECAKEQRTRVDACMPPTVAKPRKGPCPGTKRGPRSMGDIARTAGKTAGKARAKAARGAPGSGRDLSAMLNMDKIANLPRRTGAGGDARMGAIAKEQGFDAPARIVDTVTLDKAIAAGGKELVRAVQPAGGLSAEQIHDRSATGPVRLGKGIYGGGTYYSTDPVVARAYGDIDSPHWGMRRSVLSKDARTITYRQVLEAMAADTTTSSQKHQARASGLLARLAKARDVADMRHAFEVYQGSVYDLSPQDWLRTDPGAWALSRGYDAVIVPVVKDDPYDDDLDEVIVLNRGALLTERHDPTRAEAASEPPARVEACMPPTVAKPRPGPCPGSTRDKAKTSLPKIGKTGGPKSRKGNADTGPSRTATNATIPKPTAKPLPPAAAPGQAAPPSPPGGRAMGVDYSDNPAALNLDALMSLPSNAVGQPAPRLTALGARQGFDGRPALGQPRDLDELEKAGGVRMWRGTKSRKDPATGQITKGRDFAKAFRTGDMWYGGQGLRGSGVYTSTRVDTAYDKDYSDRGDDLSVNEMVLHPDAKTVDYRTLVAEMTAQRTPEQQARIDEYEDATIAMLDTVGGPQARHAAARKRFEQAAAALTAHDKYLSDSSVYAMSKGYDALSHPEAGGERNFVLLNRTALTMLARKGDDRETVDDREAVAASAWLWEPDTVWPALPGPAQVTACMPPRVARPRPGPCPGVGKPGRGLLPKARPKAKATPTRAPKAVQAPAPPPDGGKGPDGVRASLMHAQTIAHVDEAAQAAAHMITGRYIPFDLGGTDVHIARQHAEGVLQGLEAFPAANLRAVGSFDSKYGIYAGKRYKNALAITAPGIYGSKISFNTQFTDDPARYLRALKDSSHGHLTVATPTGIALHEFGHVMGFQTQAATASKKISNAMAASIGVKPSKLVQGQLGAYAKKDSGELLAEGFADAMTRRQAASPISKAILAEIASRYDARTPGAGRRAAQREQQNQGGPA